MGMGMGMGIPTPMIDRGGVENVPAALFGPRMDGAAKWPRILFVCLGNICRSPTAHGVFRAKARLAGAQVTTDCAGTGDWHIGQPPDPRALRAARERGYDLSDLRARQFLPEDFGKFDLILAMDRANLRDIEAQRPKGSTTPAHLFGLYLDEQGRDIPDPYLSGGFDSVLTMIEQCADGLVREIGGPGTG